MFKLLFKNEKLERELGKKVKLFGKEISVKVVYIKTKNPELNLVGDVINVYLPIPHMKEENNTRPHPLHSSMDK